MRIRDRLLNRVAGDYITRRIAEATADNDAHWRSLSAAGKDLPYTTLRQQQLDSLEAYRSNPLAFRIVELTTDYVLGKGLTVSAKPQSVDAFVQRFWLHKLNRMPARLHDLSTELALTGELFISFHTNQYDGMTYLRIIPSTSIDEIETAPNDPETELRFHQVASLTPDPGALTPDARWWSSTDMHHYAINRITGATRGQGDLFPVLPWLRRYKDWLTDRVIINKYKGAYLWDITLTGADPATLKRKQAELAATAPTSGSFIVHNEAEAWRAVQPNINADSSQADGRFLRMMVATGTGTPLHWLGEGTDYNRAVGQLMDEPARRRNEKRQEVMSQIIHDILDTVIERARAAGTIRASRRPYSIAIQFPDLTTTDNLALAQAVNTVASALQVAVDRKWLTNETAAEWLYQFGQQARPAQAKEPEQDELAPEASY